VVVVVVLLLLHHQLFLPVQLVLDLVNALQRQLWRSAGGISAATKPA
jgi:hypothetical protein